MELMQISENGIEIVFEKDTEGHCKLLHFSALPFDEAQLPKSDGKVFTERFNALEIMVSGQDRPLERHGNKYISTCPGCRMQFRELRDTRTATGRLIELVQNDAICGLETVSSFRFYDGIPVVRCKTQVTNTGTEPQGLEYVSSFALTGIEKEGILPADEKMRVSIPHNGWQRELQWHSYSFKELGLEMCQPHVLRRSSKTIACTNTGNWSSKEYLPMGLLENTETGSALVWQIEHNGSWHWEISDQADSWYLQLSGPTEIESGWWKELKPGETFETVPVAVGAVTGGFDEAMQALTRYRRAIRRPNADDEKLPVIFNDYMNCLFGDPTTEKELPLIDAAQKAGCEYFVMDSGWYSDGYWWDNVGEWLPAKNRFPNGLKEVMDRVRERGMIPGIWLEIEVMGINSPKLAQTHPDWFFVRHGKRVYDRSRYQLDFRCPEVVAHANEVIDRLVRDYGIGYIKMDYNIEPGLGTETDADSFGDGLLQHERAYLAWIDSVFARYPDLVIENCSSGGMRIDYAMLSRHSLQSTSDQEDYLNYASIAANAPSALTPEQSAVWAYPMPNGDREATVFNMCNAMLMRVHQSGQLAKIAPEDFELVREALDYYKSIRSDIGKAVPFWPLGFSSFGDEWIAMGLRTEKKAYIAVWRRNAHSEYCVLPMPFLKGKNVTARCAYPTENSTKLCWNPAKSALTVCLEAPVCARIFELKF